MHEKRFWLFFPGIVSFAGLTVLPISVCLRTTFGIFDKIELHCRRTSVHQLGNYGGGIWMWGQRASSKWKVLREVRGGEGRRRG